jgi:hypothetical protein
VNYSTKCVFKVAFPYSCCLIRLALPKNRLKSQKRWLHSGDGIGVRHKFLKNEKGLAIALLSSTVVPAVNYPHGPGPPGVQTIWGALSFAGTVSVGKAT